MTDDSSHMTAMDNGTVIRRERARSSYSSISSASMVCSSAAGFPTFLQPGLAFREPIDIAELREQIRKELIAEKNEKSSLKEPVKERMKRKLDSALNEAETDE